MLAPLVTLSDQGGRLRGTGVYAAVVCMLLWCTQLTHIIALATPPVTSHRVLIPQLWHVEDAGVQEEAGRVSVRR